MASTYSLACQIGAGVMSEPTGPRCPQCGSETYVLLIEPAVLQPNADIYLSRCGKCGHAFQATIERDKVIIQASSLSEASQRP